MKIREILTRPAGRRLEFREHQGFMTLPAGLEGPQQIQGEIHHAFAEAGILAHEYSGQAQQLQTGVLPDGKRTSVSCDAAPKP